MRIILVTFMLFTTVACSSMDKSKIERHMLIEGKFDCETGEYYQAHSEEVLNKSSLDPNAVMTQEQYTCARYGKVPKGKEVKSFEYLKQLRDENRETIYMLFVPCDYMKDKTYMCKY